jgi:SAM-dependent methyltransferase
MGSEIRFHLPPPVSFTPTGLSDPLRYYYHPIIGKLYSARINLVLSLLPKKRFSRELEIGYGSGIVIPTIIDNLADTYYGVDMDSDPDQVQRNLANLGYRSNIHLLKDDIAQIDIGSFDLIIAISVFEHISDIHGLVSILHRHLADDGLLLVGMPRVDRWMNALFRLMGFSGIEQLHTTPFNTFLTACLGKFKIVEQNHYPRLLPGNIALYYGCLLAPFSPNE